MYHSTANHPEKMIEITSAADTIPNTEMNTSHFFFRPTPLGFRQVVPHVQLHVAKNR